ncbi:hypothetical protein MKW94_022995 [Papaver nudicaule]|uniref:Defensin n=1 Tax=Papaver nudicaule TaxID=74823 RepID=A0AA41V7G1_PAPNU|nr:hypothetical protein [Papaver nudicaule]
MKSNSSTHMIVVLILCLLFLGGFFSYSVEAARKINGYLIDGFCRTNQDCIQHCKPKGYSSGFCEPEMKIMSSQTFICCCLY